MQSRVFDGGGGLAARTAVLVAAACVAGGLAIGARAADPILVSTRVTAPMRPDGSLLEWPKLQKVDDGLFAAAANDAESLYVAVLASTEQMRLNLAGGVVLWFDASGGHRQTFGLQLPRPEALDPGSVPGGGTAGGKLTPTVSDQVDFLGANLTRRLVELGPDARIGVGVGGEDGGIAFEARVPLAASATDTLAIGTAAGRSISLGIATPLRRRGPREPLEPIIWPDPYSYYYRRPLPPTAPLTNAADRGPRELTPKQVEKWLTVRMAGA